MANGGVAVKRKEDVSLLTQLAYKAFGLATLQCSQKENVIACFRTAFHVHIDRTLTTSTILHFSKTSARTVSLETEHY